MASRELQNLTVVLAAVNANTRFGGEAMLPVQYFRHLRSRGVDVHLICHERNRDDLTRQFPREIDRIHFTRDRVASRFVERLGRPLPRNVKSLTTWTLMSALTAMDLRREARKMVARAPAVAVVHEPIPVSPRQPSFMRAVGAPVIVGPLNGGMSYPPGFSTEVSRSERGIRWALRAVSDIANGMVDGKGRAAAVLVANARTRGALPRSARKVPIVEMVENGVDLSTFQRRDREPSGPARFAFVGRLVDWKRVDLLLDAMLQVPAGYLLEVIGAGPLSGELQRQAERLGLGDRVTFHGLLSQSSTAAVLGSCDGLVLPSIYECGGAVVLEAMAVGLPVVAADWGGPADYIQHDVTGMLVSPTNPEELTAGLAAGMTRLGEDRALGQKMGGAGRLRVEAEFDWVRKVDAMCEVYLNATEKKIQGINALETAQ